MKTKCARAQGKSIIVELFRLEVVEESVVVPESSAYEKSCVYVVELELTGHEKIASVVAFESSAYKKGFVSVISVTLQNR